MLEAPKRGLQVAGTPDAGARDASAQPSLIGSLSIVAGVLALGALTHRSPSQPSEPADEAPAFREPLKLHFRETKVFRFQGKYGCKAET